MFFRPEENALLLWDPGSASTGFLSGPELTALGHWAAGGPDTTFISRLKKAFPLRDTHRPEISRALDLAAERTAPPRSFCAPESLHIEITASCGLSCPQCYKGGASPGELPFPRLLAILDEAEQSKVFQIAIGGGEPLLYPLLDQAIRQVCQRGMAVSVTTSGAGLTAERLEELCRAGLHHLQISLNGSSEAVNGRSRDGYSEAVQALSLLAKRPADQTSCKSSCPSYGINWVARRDNLADLPKLLQLAKDFGAENVNLLRYKPSPAEEYEAVRLTADDCHRLRRVLRNTRGISIKVDSAFSNLLCSLNHRTGFMSGCGAGRRFLAVGSDGRFRPCSHIQCSEPDMPAEATLSDYWNHSPQLARFREVPARIGEPCASCSYLLGCGSCRALTPSAFYSGDGECPWHTK